MEGRCALAGHLCQPGLRGEAPSAPCVRHVRPVRRTRRPSPGPLTTHNVSVASYDDLRAALGDPVLDPELLERALTHRSYAYENGGLPTNERLEFLGDSVLGVVVTTVAAYGRDVKKSTAVGKRGATALWLPNIGPESSRWRRISSQAL